MIHFFFFFFWLGLVPMDEPGNIFRAYRFSRHKIWPARLLSGVEVDTEVRGQEESVLRDSATVHRANRHTGRDRRASHFRSKCEKCEKWLAPVSQHS